MLLFNGAPDTTLGTCTYKTYYAMSSRSNGIGTSYMYTAVFYIGAVVIILVW